MKKRSNIQRGGYREQESALIQELQLFLRQVNQGSKHSIVQSGNKLMKQIYPQSGTLTGGLCLSSSTVMESEFAPSAWIQNGSD